MIKLLKAYEIIRNLLSEAYKFASGIANAPEDLIDTKI